MRDIAAAALDAAELAGASYADVRVVEERSESITVRTGRVEGVASSETMGLGIRVIADGAWGFAATAEATEEAIRAAAHEAVALARAAARTWRFPVRLADAPAVRDRWRGPCETDPFAVPIEEKISLLLTADEAMRAEPLVSVTEASLDSLALTKVFASTDGAFIEQSYTEVGAGIAARAITDGEVLTRSYPNSHGGQHLQGGWEAIVAMDLPGNAPRIAEQAAALTRAALCPSGTTTVILDGSQVALQVHESIGHPTELDRVLGDEAAFAGTSWVRAADLGTLKYGSDRVNVVADATTPGSLGSFAYDDEGVPAQRFDVVREGVLVGFLSSRESAAAIGRASTGCARASGWNRIPLVRMTTVSLEPGEWDLDALIADTDEGLLMETNSSWSIDDRRLNFQFACEVGWEIKGGKLGRMVKNPNYTGITPQFWASCDAVCSARHWQVWGVPNCGKGEPMQVAHVAHGAAPARFRDVQVGVAR
ncbi:MAG: TldD/PmbA family protein [Coriobacteriia bacterium]|nr:TldD/PmbA family protein [Coriobacteriia bacterium]